MKYVNEKGEAISGFYNLNKEMIEINKKRGKTCMNPECFGLSFLKDGERPQTYLGKVCWNCKSANFLKDNGKE